MKKLLVILLCFSAFAFNNKSIPNSNSFVDTAPFFGIYPSDFQTSYGERIGRRVVYASTWNNGTPYSDSILLNVDWNYKHTYGSDSSKFGKKVQHIYNAIHPQMIVVENEELLSGNLTQYIKNLQATSWRLKSKATNGGITMKELGHWYYLKTEDTAFLHHNVTDQAGLLAGAYTSDSSRVAQELNAIKNLDSLTLWNVHFYFTYATQCQGIVRCINYTSTFLGKRAMSNEFGTYTLGLFDSAASIAKQTKMYWGIAYSGNGMISRPILITEPVFDNATP